MGKLALVKYKTVVEGQKVKHSFDYTADPAHPRGLHVQSLLGNARLGWTLCWLPHPEYITLNGGVVLDADRLSMTVGEIPAAKRQAIKTWLENHGVDTSTMTLDHTIREVLVYALRHIEAVDMDVLRNQMRKYLAD